MKDKFCQLMFELVTYVTCTMVNRVGPCMNSFFFSLDQ